jgi:predicted metalloenzyme YecM
MMCCNITKKKYVVHTSNLTSSLSVDLSTYKISHVCVRLKKCIKTKITIVSF